MRERERKRPLPVQSKWTASWLCAHEQALTGLDGSWRPPTLWNLHLLRAHPSAFCVCVVCWVGEVGGWALCVERERECVCVRERERERERGNKREMVSMGYLLVYATVRTPERMSVYTSASRKVDKRMPGCGTCKSNVTR